jgi:cell division ATPase FtsA
MSFFSFFKKNKESYSLVINIGSGSVSGGIVEFTEKSGEKVIHYAKEVFPFQEEISVSKHLTLMQSSLSTLVEKIRKSSSEKVSRIFYIFSSPWSISQTKVIRIKESKPFKVTESYLDHQIELQEKQFQTEIATVGKIIEKKIIQVKINGYVVNDFYNKTTKDLEITVFFTVVPENILSSVEEAVSKTYSVNNIWCHSLSLSFFSIIRDFFPNKEDFIHMDVSEEITDICIIKDSVLVSSASIPLGRNDFMRELAKSLNVTSEIADSMVRMHSAKNNDELGALKLAVAMDKAAISWQTKITAVLDSFKQQMYVPESVFLIASNDLAYFLKEQLQRHDFKVSLIDNRNVSLQAGSDDVIFKLELMFLDNLYKI